MMFSCVLLSFGCYAAAQNIDFLRDPGTYGPPLETVHAYYGQWPTGA